MGKLQGWQIENIFTLFVTVLGMVGLYFAGAGAKSFWALVFLINLNTPKAKAGE